jgi:hypothetical protein
VAFLRHYAVQLRALSFAAPPIGLKLRQISYSLDADADQLEKVVSGEGLSEEEERAFYGVSVSPVDDPSTPSKGEGAFAECLDAIRQGTNAALHWPRPQSD